MTDTFTLQIAFLGSLFPPFAANGRGQSCRLASPPAYCACCGEALIELEFGRRYVFVCDNWHCYIFRQPQGYKAKGRPTDYAVEPAGTFVTTRV